MSRYIPPALRQKMSSEPKEASTTPDETASSAAAVSIARRTLAQLSLNDAASPTRYPPPPPPPCYTVREIAHHYQTSGPAEGTLHDSHDRPKQLAYVLLYKGANPRFESEGIVYVHTRIHLLPGYDAFRADKEKKKEKTGRAVSEGGSGWRRLSEDRLVAAQQVDDGWVVLDGGDLFEGAREGEEETMTEKKKEEKEGGGPKGGSSVGALAGLLPSHTLRSALAEAVPLNSNSEEYGTVIDTIQQLPKTETITDNSQDTALGDTTLASPPLSEAHKEPDPDPDPEAQPQPQPQPQPDDGEAEKNLTPPIPVFTQTSPTNNITSTNTSSSPTDRNFVFAGHYVLRRIAFLPPRSPELARMLAQKGEGQEGRKKYNKSKTRTNGSRNARNDDRANGDGHPAAPHDDGMPGFTLPTTTTTSITATTTVTTTTTTTTRQRDPEKWAESLGLEWAVLRLVKMGAEAEAEAEEVGVEVKEGAGVGAGAGVSGTGVVFSLKAPDIKADTLESGKGRD